MDRINELCDELLVKILSFVPTKVAVSTSVLSKRWEFLWMWVPKLEYIDYNDTTVANRSESSYREVIYKNLQLHRAPIIESLRLIFYTRSVQPEFIKLWVAIAVSRCVRELSISYCSCSEEPDIVLPSSVYTCKSLVSLELEGRDILVDVPPTVCLPSLKTLKLLCVTHINGDSLRLLISNCPVLEELVIERHKDDNVKALVVNLPSLQRLSLEIDSQCSSDVYLIVTPSLKYLKVEDYRSSVSYLGKHMPKLEEAQILVANGLKDFIDSIASVKRLSLQLASIYRTGIVFHRLEHLELFVGEDYWSKLVVRLLNDSPKLRVLKIYICRYQSERYERIQYWSSVPKCLLESLETFKFGGHKGRPEERDFLSFILNKARCLKSTSILRSESGW